MELWKLFVLGSLLMIALPAQADEDADAAVLSHNSNGPCALTDIWTEVPPRFEIHWPCVVDTIENTVEDLPLS